jgi:hypothetical protein
MHNGDTNQEVYGLSKNSIYLTKEILCSGLHSNSALPKYKATAIPPDKSVGIYCHV